MATWNENPRPFVWHKTGDEILDSLAGYLQRIPRRLEPLRDRVPDVSGAYRSSRVKSVWHSHRIDGLAIDPPTSL
jgi:hypothetical protein